MNRLILFPLLLAAACLIAGVYGMLHNQVSFTVSPEYFTQFKFHQFELIPIKMPARDAAAIVGWRASWWMGIPVGFVLIPFGLIIPGMRTYAIGVLKAFTAVVLTTMLVGLFNLAYAYVLYQPGAVGQITRYGNEIDDDLAFAWAGAMHNGGYRGGMYGIAAGALVIYREHQRVIRATNNNTTGEK